MIAVICVIIFCILILLIPLTTIFYSLKITLDCYLDNFCDYNLHYTKRNQDASIIIIILFFIFFVIFIIGLSI